MSIVIDNSKAFDIIGHEFLIRKLISLNFSNSSIKIILSYLINLKQHVQVNDKQCTRLPIYFGVPQGSVLVPVLFNIYVPKLSASIESNSIRYADETNIYKSSSKANTIPTIRTVENDISKFFKWSKNNGLVFNNEKLKVLHSRQERLTMIKASLSDQKLNLYSKSRQQNYLVQPLTNT